MSWPNWTAFTLFQGESTYPCPHYSPVMKGSPAHSFPQLTGFPSVRVLYLLQSSNKDRSLQGSSVWSCTPTSASLLCICQGYEGMRHIPLHAPFSGSESLSSQSPCNSFKFLLQLPRPSSNSACHGDLHVNISCADSSVSSKTYQFTTSHPFNASPQYPLHHLVIYAGPYNRPPQSRFQSAFWSHGGIACFIVSFLFLVAATFLTCFPSPNIFNKTKRLFHPIRSDPYAYLFLWRGVKLKVPSRLTSWQHPQEEDKHIATLFMQRGARQVTPTCISQSSSISSRLTHNLYSMRTAHFPPNIASTDTSGSTDSPTLSFHFGAHIIQPSNHL